MPGADSPLAALEALIFASSETVSQTTLKKVLGWTPGQIAAGVQDINKQLEATGRPYEIVEVSGGFRFRTRPEFGDLLANAQPEKRVKLSRASLDTLAVIAYRQPISRPEIEEIRSVDSGAVVRGLLDRGLVRIVGRRDAPGRPALYGTSAQFLEVFGLSSLRDLPDLRDLVATEEVEATPIEAAIAHKQDASASEPTDRRDDAAQEAGDSREIQSADGSSAAAHPDPGEDRAGEAAESEGSAEAERMAAPEDENVAAPEEPASEDPARSLPDGALDAPDPSLPEAREHPADDALLAEEASDESPRST